MAAHMTLSQAIILAVVEALTEFLPVSSTGHMIIASYAMGIHQNDFVKDFTIIIQFAAILAVLTLYWKRFLRGWLIYRNLLISFLPAGALGLLVKDHIDYLLGSVTVVAWALIVGGIFLCYVDRLFPHGQKPVEEIESFGMLNCLKIGFIQCLAFIPGVSRAGATIVGGVALGLTRAQAAEFSFLLAVPTLFAASALKFYKAWPQLNSDTFELMAVAGIVTFGVSILIMKSFVQFLTRYGFKAFGIYRIVLGILILIMVAIFNHDLKLM